MSLWLCLRFEQLPLQALIRRDNGLATATAVLEKQRVLQACDTATSLGLKPGMRVATVRALDESIRLLERDPDLEQQCLQQLCCWAYSISPSLHIYRDNCLLLEIGGCLTLFKGLECLLARVHSDLSSRGYSYLIGLAETPKAAWLLSHTTDDHQRPLPERLQPLPLRLLDMFPNQLDSLARAGLWQFGDILSLSTQALGRRCGKDMIHFLQQALGTAHDPQPDYRPAPQFHDDYWFGYEVKANQELLPAIQRLLQSLCQFLRNTQLQCRQIQWQLYGIQDNLHSLTVASSLAHANWREWYQLSQLHIEQLTLDMGVEGVSLQCLNLTPGNNSNGDLFNPYEQREPLHSLLDRLQSRLGLQSVKKIAGRNEHLPEFAGYSSCNNYGDGDTQHSISPAGGYRPFWLMPEPQPLSNPARGLQWGGTLDIMEGPERIEDNWWLEPVSRDYYVAHDQRGQKYWVYRDRLQNQWFIQGVFA